MTIVTKEIGTTARDYSTITLWEAALGGAAGGAGNDAVGECYDDSALDEHVNINDATPSSVRLTVASGERHDGTDGTGARIVRTSSSILIETTTAATIEWLECDANGTDCDPDGWVVNPDVANSITQRLLIHGVSRAGNWPSGLVVRYAAGQIHTNLIIYDIVNSLVGSGGGAYGLDDQSGSVPDLANITIHDVSSNSTGNAYGAHLDADAKARNILVTDTSNPGSGAGDDFNPADGGYSGSTVSHNLSSDATAPDDNDPGTALHSKTSANQFVSNTAPYDLHLKAGADAIDAGVDLVTTPTGVNIDIDGEDRNADVGGALWDIGADEYVSAAAAGTIIQIAMASYRRRRV